MSFSLFAGDLNFIKQTGTSSGKDSEGFGGSVKPPFDPIFYFHGKFRDKFGTLFLILFNKSILLLLNVSTIAG